MRTRASQFQCIAGSRRSLASTGLPAFSTNWNSPVSLGCDWSLAFFHSFAMAVRNTLPAAESLLVRNHQ